MEKIKDCTITGCVCDPKTACLVTQKENHGNAYDFNAGDIVNRVKRRPKPSVAHGGANTVPTQGLKWRSSDCIANRSPRGNSLLCREETGNYCIWNLEAAQAALRTPTQSDAWGRNSLCDRTGSLFSLSGNEIHRSGNVAPVDGLEAPPAA